MSDIYFKCACGKSLAVDEQGIGRTVSCVDCGKPVQVPEPDIEFHCPGCGETLLAPSSIIGDRIKCAVCRRRMQVPSVIESEGVGAVMPASEITTLKPTTDASRLMNELTRRRMGFRLLRKPAQAPSYSRRVFAVCLAALALVAGVELVRCAAKKKSDRDALSPRAVVCEVESQIEDERSSAVPAVLTSSKNRAVETGSGSETIAAIECEPVQSELQTPETVLSAARNQVDHEPASSALPSVMPKEEAIPIGLAAAATGSAESSGSNAEGAMHLINRVFAIESLMNTDAQKFWKDLSLLWAEILEYTTTHSGAALDEDYWSPAFQSTADWMLGNDSLTYERSLALVNQALEVLRNAKAAKRGAPVQLAMMMAVLHTSKWMSGHVRENAEMIDGLWEWAKSLDDPALRRACFCQTYSFEGNLLINRFGVPEEEREAFIKEREKKLWEFLDDEELPLNDRTDALSHWAMALNNAGRSNEARAALETWRHRHGEKIVPARYNHVFMEVALFGIGDWELASRAVLEAGRHTTQWRSSYDHWSYGEMCRVYYKNMLFNDYETARAGSEHRKKMEAILIKMAGGEGS